MECPCGSKLESWIEYDGYRIYLCRVCEKCEKEKMSIYRSDIKEAYECDEPIEPEGY